MREWLPVQACVGEFGHLFNVTVDIVWSSKKVTVVFLGVVFVEDLTNNVFHYYIHYSFTITFTTSFTTSFTITFTTTYSSTLSLLHSLLTFTINIPIHLHPGVCSTRTGSDVQNGRLFNWECPCSSHWSMPRPLRNARHRLPNVGTT